MRSMHYATKLLLLDPSSHQKSSDSWALRANALHIAAKYILSLILFFLSDCGIEQLFFTESKMLVELVRPLWIQDL